MLDALAASGTELVTVALRRVSVDSAAENLYALLQERNYHNPHNLDLMRRRIQVPLIVDAGVGTASDVAIAFELGIDGVLLNSAIARAQDPVRMAAAMRHAAIAGREALLAGRMPRRTLADPTSPMAGRVVTTTAAAARPSPAVAAPVAIG